MFKVYFLDADVRFDDKLIYASGMGMETTLCPVDAGLPTQHTMRQRWTKPIRVIGPVQRLTDIEWSVYADVLVEEDIANQLQSAGFSGIEFCPAQIYTTTETPIGRQLLELKVTGWGGMANPSSGINVQEQCTFCGRAVYRGQTNAANIFDIDKWDGSDFFMIWPMPRRVFITKEAADFIQAEGFSGVKVRELSELPKSIAGSYSPGHIEDWFETEKAAEIRAGLKKDA